MNQQDLAPSLHPQGQSAPKIHHHLVQAFGELAIAYSTISRTIRTLSWATPDEEASDLGGRPPNLMINARIQQFLIDDPGGPISQITAGTGILASTAGYVLMTRWRYIWRKCRFVPHTLSEAQRMERLQRSQALLITFRPAKSIAWRFFSTGDESWFFHYTPDRRLWIPPDVQAPEVARQLIATPKLMVTIFWDLSAIHVIDYLPPDTFV